MDTTANSKQASISQLAADLEQVLLRHFGSNTPAVVIVLSFPARDKTHWIANVNRRDSARLLEAAAGKMVY